MSHLRKERCASATSEREGAPAGKSYVEVPERGGAPEGKSDARMPKTAIATTGVPETGDEGRCA